MKTTLQSLQESISNAVDMIDHSQLVSDDLLLQQSTKYSTNSLDFTNATSLLDKCEQVTNSYKKTKPDIRVIHHFACSGGSLFTKCLSSMANTFILSEVHPHFYQHLQTDMATFLPSDIATLAMQAGVPEPYKLARQVFKQSIKTAHGHVEQLGGVLVLRDHSHSDFCIGTEYRHKTLITKLLKDDFDVISIATVRNPIDAYSSLLSNGWVHFNPQTFDAYCERLSQFLAQFKKRNIIYYEDFVSCPETVMEKMCLILNIEYDESFMDLYDQFKVTGDSGRKSSGISKRRRREVSAELKNEIEGSKHFRLICKEYKFHSTIQEVVP
jgi:hypothetical protein